jgi:hypothetical protein
LKPVEDVRSVRNYGIGREGNTRCAHAAASSGGKSVGAFAHLCYRTGLDLFHALPNRVFSDDEGRH